MKFVVNVECTPDELRAALGLPDLKPVHEVYTDKLRDLVNNGVKPEDVEKLMSAWMPNAEGWRQLMRTAMDMGTLNKK